jgi:NitT/TauT family transport system permease protein
MTDNTRQIHHHHHPGYSYPVHRWQKIYGLVIAPLAVLLIAIAVLHPDSLTFQKVSIVSTVGALLASLLRLLTAYVLSLVLALPLAMLINRSPLTERILLPVFDILQSVPVLAFFPVILVFFVRYQLLNGAAIFILFMTMLWSIVFSLVGGLRLLPADIKSAAKIFNIRRLQYVRQIILPAVFPFLVTGSLLAWASGWNILIVAEVLHTYLPHGSNASDLFGIGSQLVHASAAGQSGQFVVAIVVMVVAIILMNFFVWQRLLHFAERFRFE